VYALIVANGKQNLARMANGYIDHPIVDATGLEAGGISRSVWTPKGMLQMSAPNPNQTSGAIAESSDPCGISVFEAVQKELGLKLAKQTRSIP
jgi:uncharacterized protein (TIGR03435 family)